MNTNNPFNNKQLSSTNELSIREVLFILKKNIGIITSTILVCLIFSTLYVLLQYPLYISSATIMIEDPSSKVDIFDMGFQSN